MTKNPVGWFEIYVQDMPRAKAFYEAVFGKKLEKLESPMADLESPMADLEMWAFPWDEGTGSAGALAKMKGVSSGGNSTLVYFSCQDCATESARVVMNGGKLCREKFSIGQYGFIALAQDTEGNEFGLHSAK